jgi:hypothetical protein
MPNSFSIENDITPMRNRFFSSGLKGSEASYLNKAYGPSTKEIKETMDIYAAIDRQRDRDLAYQMNLEALQKRRDDAARERDIQSRVPDLLSRINEINKGEGDALSKGEALAALQAENPYVSGTKLGSAVMGAAYKGLEYQTRAQIKRDNEAEKERTKTKSRLAPYVAAGAVDEVKKINRADGVVDETELESEALASFYKQGAATQQETERVTKEREGFIDLQDSLVKKGYSVLDSIKYETPDGGEMPAAITGGAPAAAVGLTKESRRDMERILARIERKPLKEIRNRGYSDDDMQEVLYEKVFDMETKLQGIKYPSIQGSTSPSQDPNKTKTSSKWK